MELSQSNERVDQKFSINDDYEVLNHLHLIIKVILITY